MATTRENEVVYCGDTRYPGPGYYPVPPGVEGTPTQAELDAHPRLFTWGELKEIIQTSNLGKLSRNKELQARYEVWMAAQRARWGSTEAYLIHARLPWARASHTGAPEPTYDQHTALSHPEVDLTPSTNPKAPKAKLRIATPASGAAAVAQHALSPKHARFPKGETPGYSHKATVPSTPASGSGASTPSSVAYVNIDDALEKVSRRLKRRAASVRSGTSASSEDDAKEQGGQAEGEEEEPDVFLSFDPARGLDTEKYAVLPNDWPYCVPYGVRHFCVWSRVPIAHPVLVGYDRAAWAHIEEEGLAGFTGVIPSFAEENNDSGDKLNGGPGRSGPAQGHPAGGWYAVDVAYAGAEVQRWAGVRYESRGGQNVGAMVRGLWDERGWETVWFVNPARLQSVPGFSHFHVFARRKTPEEINVSERVFPPLSSLRSTSKGGEAPKAGGGEAEENGGQEEGGTPALDGAERGETAAA